VRLSRVVIAAALAIAACGGSPSSSRTSPSPSVQPTATSSTSASPSSIPTGTSGGAALVHCTTTVPAGDNLVIGTVTGDPTIVVRDIQDPANAKNLCQFDTGATSPQFVSATQVAYETGSNQLIKVDLATGSTTLLAGSGASGSRQFAASPDGRSITYLDGNAWHLVTPSGDRLLTTLPPVPGRGVNPDEDDSFLSFSPDGLYIALVQTFHVGGTGATAPDQVRKATDGSLVYSTSGMTMGVWASVPSRLFFRDSAGTVHRWDPSSGLSSMLPLHWIQPRSSPDGRWIAYTFRTSSGLGGIGLYSVQANSVSNTTPPGRSQARFLSNDLVWYIGERACSTCLGGQPTPTGVTFIYEIAGAAEVVSRLSGVLDAWPHSTPPGL
jgi:WD40-like Beta Propeller Repeat